MINPVKYYQNLRNTQGTQGTQGTQKTQTLQVEQGVDIANANQGSNVSSRVSTENVDESEKEYLKADMDNLLSNAKGYTKKVDIKNLTQAMFTAQDLSEIDDENCKEQAGKILNNVQSTVEHSDVISGIKVHDGKPENLHNKLSEEQTNEYLQSDNAKKMLNELGINANTANGKTSYTLNGKSCNVEMDQDGTLRLTYIENKNGEPSERAVDFKLQGNDFPKANNTTESKGKTFEYTNDDDLVTKLKEQNPNADIATIQDLDGENGVNLLSQVQDLTGKRIGNGDGDLKIQDNYAVWTEDKDGQKIEHRAYLDKNSGSLVTADITSNEDGTKNVTTGSKKASSTYGFTHSGSGLDKKIDENLKNNDYNISQDLKNLIKNDENGEVSQKLKDALGTDDLNDVDFKNNYAVVKDKNTGVENRYYYDTNTGSFIHASVTDNEKGEKEVKIDYPDTTNYRLNHKENLELGNVGAMDLYNGIDVQQLLTDKGKDVDINSNNFSSLMYGDENKNGALEEKIKAITGKDSLEGVKINTGSNYATYTDDNGTEHRLYLDNKSGELINININKDPKKPLSQRYSISADMPNERARLTSELERSRYNRTVNAPEFDKENSFSYSVQDRFARPEEHLKEKGYDIELTDINSALRSDKYGTKLKQLEALSGFKTAKIDNQLVFVDSDGKQVGGNTSDHIWYKDENGVEHQYYFDAKSGNWFNLNKKDASAGSGNTYDIEVNFPKEWSQNKNI